MFVHPISMYVSMYTFKYVHYLHIETYMYVSILYVRNFCVCLRVCMLELRLRGKTFENSLYRVNLKDENQNVLSTYLAVPRQAQFNPG